MPRKKQALREEEDNVSAKNYLFVGVQGEVSM